LRASTGSSVDLDVHRLPRRCARAGATPLISPGGVGGLHFAYRLRRSSDTGLGWALRAGAGMVGAGAASWSLSSYFLISQTAEPNALGASAGEHAAPRRLAVALGRPKRLRASRPDGPRACTPRPFGRTQPGRHETRREAAGCRDRDGHSTTNCAVPILGRNGMTAARRRSRERVDGCLSPVPYWLVGDRRNRAPSGCAESVFRILRWGCPVIGRVVRCSTAAQNGTIRMISSGFGPELDGSGGDVRIDSV
jgi:hypothetical protein